MYFLFIAVFAVLAIDSVSCYHLSHSGCIKKFSTTSLLSSVEGGGERTYANYVIYKSKAAVAVKIIAPTFQVSGRSRTVSREGGLLIEFANSSGPKEYDWTKKGTFLLAAAECGELLLLDQSKTGAEFFHDPNMGTPTAGQVTKKLKLSTAADGKGLYVSLMVNDKAKQSTSYSVPVSWGELQVLKSIASFSIPRMLGFDQVWENQAPVLGDVAPPPPPPQMYKNFFPDSK